MRKSALVFLSIILTTNLFSAKIPLRTEVSLNGTWSFTPVDQVKQKIKVPDYWDAHPEFKSVSEAVYEREVLIPDTKDWQDKRIQIEFEAVNFICDVFVNDNLVTSHIGGWISFTADITEYVTPGESFILKVAVKGGNHEPIVDKKGMPVWPVGFFGQRSKWGIVFDVWLRAYGKLNIQDTFIQTSFREEALKVEYSFLNTTDTGRQLKVKGKVVSSLAPSTSVHEFESEVFQSSAGNTTSQTIASTWNNPILWSPENPHLYYLETSLVDANTGELLDKEFRRFGFREIWVEGPKLMLNGQRLTILGANIVQHSEFYDNQNNHYLSKESWNSTIDRLFDLNLRTVRFHMQPAPSYMLDIADERGLLVMDESAVYAREFFYEVNKKEYLKNSYKWIKPWVIDRRNHPSVIIWNAENEMGVGWLNWMTSGEMKSLGDAIRLYDTTRPVNYDGDRDVGDQLVNLHYPETYKGTISGSIYSWADSLHPNKPTGVGEFITHYGENGTINQWWMGTFVRGMRYVYFSDIRPYRHDWALLRDDNTECIENLRRSLSPVALFDKQYDDLGIDPLFYKNYPIALVGDTLQRELVLYNDEFTDTIIDIEILLKTNDTYQALYNYNGNRAPSQKIVAQTEGRYVVPLGEHIDIPYQVIVPDIYEGFLDAIDIVLVARKRGEVKFKETIRFALRSEKQGEVSGIKPQLQLFSAEEPDFRGR